MPLVNSPSPPDLLSLYDEEADDDDEDDEDEEEEEDEHDGDENVELLK